jgi:sucrose-6-phosphate hydrolase SacC (GH32 family)
MATGAALDMAGAPAPLFRDPVFDGAADPTAVWNEAAGEWWVFYTQRRASVETEGVAWCYGSAIGIAISADQGRSWRYGGTAQGLEFEAGPSTFWAPDVIRHEGLYHLFVTYIRGIYADWGGQRQMAHYTSPDLLRWQFAGLVELGSVIDPDVHRLPDGTWKMWFKDEGARSETYAATSPDLYHWTRLEPVEISGPAHEAPVVFAWRGWYWLIVDPCTDRYDGLWVYRSADAAHWTRCPDILDTPGIRPDDNDIGRHADVVLVDDRAYIFYFTHPGRTYDAHQMEQPGQGINYRRSSLQIAELEFSQGHLICNRDK